MTGGGQTLHRVWAGERRRASPEPVRRRTWKEGTPGLWFILIFRKPRGNLSLWNAISLSGGNCSVMERTPSPAASLSHATDNLSHVLSCHGAVLHIQPQGSRSVTTHYLICSTQVGFLPHESIEGKVVLRLPMACEQSPWVIPVSDATFLWATSAGGLPHSQLLTVGVGFFKDSLVTFENMFPK